MNRREFLGAIAAGVKIGDTVQLKFPPRARIVKGKLRFHTPAPELWTRWPDGWRKNA
jgi:hypothetical protein